MNKRHALLGLGVLIVAVTLSFSAKSEQSRPEGPFVAITSMQPGTGILSWAITEGGDVWFRSTEAQWTFETTIGAGGFVALSSEWTNSGPAVFALTGDGGVWLRFQEQWNFETYIEEPTGAKSTSWGSIKRGFD